MAVPLLSLTLAQAADLPTLFRFQLDGDARRLAAFMAPDSRDEAAWLAKYTRFLADPTMHLCTIRLGEEIVGSIAKFEIEQQAELTYWLARSYWGRGLATAALREFLQLEPARPLQGRVAFDNYGSQRVLEKCGFVPIGRDRGFASARQTEIEEIIYQLTTL